jgi:purine-binding chemotaxis protein CheW
MPDLLPSPTTAEPYFIFALNHFFYAVPANIVQEVVYLPELTLLATAADDVVGVFDLRGQLIPVLDLRLRFGQSYTHYEVSDGIIVLQISKQTFGVIVNEVYDVCTADSVHEAPLLYSTRINSELPEPLLIGSLKKDSMVITLLNPRALLQQTFSPNPENNSGHVDFYSRTRPESREIFTLRAEQLKWQEIREDASSYLALAVILLNDEYYGIDLLSVREFANIEDIVPIPCTPEHILGCLNLRGNVITLMDMRRAIHLPQKPLQPESKAVVINSPDDFAIAVMVDSILEVIYVNPQKITPVPTTVAAVSGDYLTGEMRYQDKLLTLIDLNLILEKGELTVEEEA